MEIEGDILDVFANSAVSNQHHLPNFNGLDYCRVNGVANCAIADDARFFGMVLIGDNVRIGRNAIIVGPTRLGDNVSVGESATIRNSVIASDISVPRGAVVQNRVIFDQENKDKDSSCGIKCPCEKNAGASSNFRLWPIFSYVRFSKRIADIVVALIVLILFLPILPVLVLIIKLSSPGPAFFAHEREGMHEKRFSCLKFRTMIVEADRIQKGLRFKNQVDGPQFKVEDDPRITTVGRFLRETFIDEIPQFFNVLTGKMSVVGPRPSPKSENCICPFWREARLSVRPGITGLWQVRRTRLPGRDFQEWIYYDTKYVRDVSLRLDLIICWQTAKKLVLNFFNQF